MVERCRYSVSVLEDAANFRRISISTVRDDQFLKLGVYRLLSPRTDVRVSPICLRVMSAGDGETWNTVV